MTSKGYFPFYLLDDWDILLMNLFLLRSGNNLLNRKRQALYLTVSFFDKKCNSIFINCYQ